MNVNFSNATQAEINAHDKSDKINLSAKFIKIASLSFQYTENSSALVCPYNPF